MRSLVIVLLAVASYCEYVQAASNIELYSPTSRSGSDGAFELLDGAFSR